MEEEDDESEAPEATFDPTKGDTDIVTGVDELSRMIPGRSAPAGRVENYDPKLALTPEQTRFPSGLYNSEQTGIYPNVEPGDGSNRTAQPMDPYQASQLSYPERAAMTQANRDEPAELLRYLRANPGYGALPSDQAKMEELVRRGEISPQVADYYLRTGSFARSALPPMPSFSEMRKAKQAGGVHDRSYIEE